MTTRTIGTTGAELTLDDSGGDGPALVFLHYWGGSARTWDGVAGRLPASVRTVLVNQRGWGGSRATDGRHDLGAMADDVEAVVAALGLGPHALVGHSMGGKVAQIVAGRRPPSLAGLVLVAPAPPIPMAVPAEARAGMLASYGSREGIEQALGVLAGSPLGQAQRERVIEDTLRGAPEAKREWTERGMLADASAGLGGLTLPVEVLVGERDGVEREAALRPVFARLLPQATVTLVPGVGHLLPLEAPDAVAAACGRMLGAMRQAA